MATTTTAPIDLVLSPEDRARVARVEALARSGAEGVRALLELLTDPSWPVRRAVVAALASVEDAAVEGLGEILLERRDHEGRLAAAVDALVASRGDVDGKMMDLAASAVALPVVCDAVQVLGRRRARRAVPLLAKLSAHEDANVAVGSIEALGRIGGVDTVDALVAAVEARDFFRTFPAIDALGRTGGARAVESLTAILGDPLYAAEAARALGSTGHESAVAPLAALLVEAPVALVRTAAVALAELRERYELRFGDNDTIRAALSLAVEPALATRHVIESMGRVVLSDHRDLVSRESHDPSELVAIARVLGWLGDEGAIVQLVELTMADAPVGPAAGDALRRLGSLATSHVLAAIRDGDSARRLRFLPLVGYAAGTIDDLLRCLDDTDPEVRVRACEALARLANPAAVSSLFRLIGDRDGRVSQSAAAAIQSFGSLETKRLALGQAASTDARTRRAALRILSYFGYPEGLDVLIAAMSDDDEKIREAAIYGLPLVDDPRGTEALLAIATHEAPRTRAAVMRALGQTSNAPAAVTALRAGLADPDAWVRYYACQSLGRLRVDAACEAIVALMEDARGQVRVAAVEALAHLRGARAAEALAAATRGGDADMRRAALLGLGIAKRPESVPLLREAATAQDSATRLVAIGALSEFDSPDVVPALAHATSDPDDAVRGAAIGYLSTRPGAGATGALLAQLSNPQVRDRALEALAVAADERVDGVLTALESADAELAPLLVAALTRMRRPSSQAALESALSFENVDARRAAASALAAIGTVEARDALLRAGSGDPDAHVRRICAAVARP